MPDPASIEDIWKTAMLTVIDFLVSVEDFEFLFVEFKRLFEAWSMREGFLEALESFILRNRIKFIPNEPFRDLIKHYIHKGKIDVLQYLIVNLSLKDIDVDNAIILCMENNLLTAHMYICSHREGAEGADFLTPIARALSMYQGSVKEESSGYQQYGYKFLWFLDMTLRGKMFPSGEIPEQIWKDKVKDIIVLLFDELNIGLMLQIDYQVSFEILSNLFEPRLSSVIESYEHESMQLIQNTEKTAVENSEVVDPKEKLRRTAQMFTQTMSNRLQAQMLALIYHCGKKEELYHNMLYYMLANLAVSLNYSLPHPVLEECLIHILEHPYTAPKWNSVGYSGPAWTLKDDDDRRNRLILELLKQLKDFLQPEKLALINQLTDKSDL